MRKRMGFASGTVAAALTVMIGAQLSSMNVRQMASAQLTSSNASPQVKAQIQQIYNKAIEAYQEGRYTICIGLLNVGKTLDARNKDLFNLLAMSYSQIGDDEHAISAFRNALTLDRNWVECRNNFAVFERKIGKVAEAQKELEECVRINPNYADAYYHLGQIHDDKGDLEKVIECYDMAARLKPTMYEAQQDLGLAIYKRCIAGGGGSLDDAVGKLELAATLAPDNPMVHYHLGRILCAQGPLDKAEERFRTALTKDDKFAAAHFELGKLRYFRGDPYRAITESKAASLISPAYNAGKGYPKVDLVLLDAIAAKSYEVIEDYDNADSSWRKVASLQPSNADTVKHLADLRKIMKNLDKKKKKVTVDPAQIRALIWKGIDQTEDDNLAGAKVTYERALELDPQSFSALQYVGESAEASNDLSGAIEKYQAAMALKPTFDGSYYNIAYVLEKMNLQAEAGLMYQKFHEISGHYPYDPKHIVSLQQEEARERARTELKKRRGY
jgi:tetratricopeptide (TPR) repeat protein